MSGLLRKKIISTNWREAMELSVTAVQQKFVVSVSTDEHTLHLVNPPIFLILTKGIVVSENLRVRYFIKHRHNLFL